MEKNHVVITKPGGNSSTENRINVLVPSPGKWTLTAFATKQSMKKMYSVFQLFFEATMGQTESIFPYVTTEFTSMSLFPPSNIREWILPQSVAKSEYPKQIEIKFIQDTEDIQLHCNAECDQQECFDAISLRHDNDPEQKSIKRTLVINVLRRGEWKFTLRDRYMHDEKSIQIELLSYSVKGYMDACVVPACITPTATLSPCTSKGIMHYDKLNDFNLDSGLCLQCSGYVFVIEKYFHF